MSVDLRDFATFIVQKGDIVVFRPRQPIDPKHMSLVRKSAHDWGRHVGVDVLVVEMEWDIMAMRKDELGPSDDHPLYRKES